MKIFLSLLFFFSFKAHAVCSFKSEVKSVYSLSGPISIALRDLQLLKSPALKGISIFHPINIEEFAGKVLPGGVFLSKNAVSEFADSIVFYDDSRELGKILKTQKNIKSVPIKTRNLTPLEVTELVIKELSFILDGCEKEIKLWEEKSKTLAEKLLKLYSHKRNVVYFLGEFKNGRIPELVISNDGVVKWLREEGRINSYPSSLAYTNWSSRILKSMPESTQYVGVVDSGKKLNKKIIKNGKKITLIYPGSLIPGISQLEAWIYLTEAP